jgi:hypothetical protein
MLVFFKVAEYEATTFSIFYNNSLFLAIVILASFYLLRVRLKFYYIYEICSECFESGSGLHPDSIGSADPDWKYGPRQAKNCPLKMKK